MARDLDTPLEIALGVVEPSRARDMDVSDCDLGKVSIYTPSRGYVGLHVVWIIYKC